MSTIKVSTEDQVLIATVVPTLAQNNINSVYLNVTFSGDWFDYPTRTAVFTTSKNPRPYPVALPSDVSNPTCTVPPEVLAEDCKLYITVKAEKPTGETKSSTRLTIKVLAGTPAVIISDPEPGVYNQLHIKNTELAARLSAIEAGTTPSGSEVLGVRTAFDGTTYTTAGDAVRAQFPKAMQVYNVTHNVPLASGSYYGLTDAVRAVPLAVRKSGLIITFRSDPEKEWEAYQYNAKDTTDVNWYNLTYWSNKGYESEKHNVYRGRIIELGYTSFEECELYGHYKFHTADVSILTDAPENLSMAGNLYVYPYFGGTSAKFIRDLDGNEWFKYKGIDWICVNYYNEQRIAALETRMSAPVNWCALGDSITEGYYSYNSGGTSYYNLNPEISWAKIVADKKGYNLTNKAVGGSGYLCTRTAEKPVQNGRDVADATNFAVYSLVTLAFGVNDWKYNCVLGSLEDDANEGGSIYANMKYIIEKILNDNPLCKIVVITPLNCKASGSYDTNWGLGYAYSNNGTLEDIFNALVTVCEWYGIEYIDMTHSSIVNRYNISDLMPDGVHPTVDCHRVLGTELASRIRF